MKFVQLTPEQRRSFDEDGFLVVKQALDRGNGGAIARSGRPHRAFFLKKPPVFDRTEYNHLDQRPGLLEEQAMVDLVTSSPVVPLIVQLLSPNIQLAFDIPHLQKAGESKRPKLPPRLAS